MSVAVRPKPSLAEAERSASSVVAWDLPTRLFKWSLVVLVVTAWISSGFDDPSLTVHKACGYGILILLIYRVLWGFFGGTTARFSSFLRSPSVVLAYLNSVRTRTAPPYLGHSPSGGLMILALLLGCGLQACLGLVASDGVLASGPFADAVGPNVAAWAGTLHAIWFYVVLGLAAVHIAVNLFHQFVKRDNLIGAMVTGRKVPDAYADGRQVVQGSGLVALACLGAAAALVALAVALSEGQFFSAP